MVGVGAALGVGVGVGVGAGTGAGTQSPSEPSRSAWRARKLAMASMTNAPRLKRMDRYTRVSLVREAAMPTAKLAAASSTSTKATMTTGKR